MFFGISLDHFFKKVVENAHIRDERTRTRLLTRDIFKDFGHGLGHGLGQSHDFGHGYDIGHGHDRKSRTRTNFGHACPLISGS